MTQAYPLQFQDFIARSARRFKTNLPAALQNVRDSLRVFGADSGRPTSDVVLSSNVSLGHEKPGDPGIAVWFKWDGEQRCIPVDRYATPAASLQAIHLIIEARRVELRHRTLALVRASMRGFQALPAPGTTPWWQVLGVEESARLEAIEVAYRALAQKRHPDRPGGSHDLMAALNRARDAALKARGGDSAA